jgi:hypothetical protein
MTTKISHRWKILSALILAVVVVSGIGSYLSLKEQQRLEMSASNGDGLLDRYNLTLMQQDARAISDNREGSLCGGHTHHQEVTNSRKSLEISLTKTLLPRLSGDLEDTQKLGSDRCLPTGLPIAIFGNSTTVS